MCDCAGGFSGANCESECALHVNNNSGCSVYDVYIVAQVNLYSAVHFATACMFTFHTFIFTRYKCTLKVAWGYQLNNAAALFMVIRFSSYSMLFELSEWRDTQ